jgi:DNA-binding NarL/FixJ family response regulator
MSTTTGPTRILIADDHAAIREGLRIMIERQEDLRVVAEARDGSEAIALCRSHRPDLVLMDLQMPNVDGLQATAAIREQRPETPVVVLTSYPGDARVSRALSAGAISYLLKTADRTVIIAAIRAGLLGRTVLDPAVTADLATHKGREQLSAREVSVLRLVAAGRKNSEIGHDLYVSEDTVKARLKNILAKLEANDRTHAVTIARHRGFLDS